jgi:hypothetical protein
MKRRDIEDMFKDLKLEKMTPIPDRGAIFEGVNESLARYANLHRNAVRENKLNIFWREQDNESLWNTLSAATSLLDHLKRLNPEAQRLAGRYANPKNAIAGFGELRSASEKIYDAIDMSYKNRPSISENVPSDESRVYVIELIKDLALVWSSVTGMRVDRSDKDFKFMPFVRWIVERYDVKASPGGSEDISLNQIDRIVRKICEEDRA